jgi:hypothetical protein
MGHPEGAGSERGHRVDFDRRVQLEFRGTQLSLDGGLLVMRELDGALGLSDLASAALCDNRRRKNTVHRLDGLFRQSVYGRLAGYEDVNDADRLALDPVRRSIDLVVRKRADVVALIETESDLNDLREKGVSGRSRH